MSKRAKEYYWRRKECLDCGHTEGHTFVEVTPYYTRPILGEFCPKCNSHNYDYQYTFGTQVIPVFEEETHE
jgi:predicted nucleic-acid-binding Zn-ribbon protein